MQLLKLETNFFLLFKKLQYFVVTVSNNRGGGTSLLTHLRGNEVIRISFAYIMW